MAEPILGSLVLHIAEVTIPDSLDTDGSMIEVSLPKSATKRRTVAHHRSTTIWDESLYLPVLRDEGNVTIAVLPVQQNEVDNGSKSSTVHPIVVEEKSFAASLFAPGKPHPIAVAAKISNAGEPESVLEVVVHATYYDLAPLLALAPDVSGVVGSSKPKMLATSDVEYSCCPPAELYRHFCGFFGINKPNAVVLKQLSAFERWELVDAVDVSTTILGDKGMLPLLMTIACCQNLGACVFDGNSLSLPSSRCIVSALRNHTGIEYLSVKDNSFFESAGEEMLRLLRINRRITHFSIDGNDCSAYLLKRIATQLEGNRQEQCLDVYNPLSSKYAHLVELQAIPPEQWKLVASIWTLLTVCPPAEEEEGKKNEENNVGDIGVDGVSLKGAVGAPMLARALGYVAESIRRRHADKSICAVFDAVSHHEELYDKSFARMLFLPVQCALDPSPDRWEATCEVLHHIGHCHYQFGVRPRHYRDAGRALIVALTECLGSEVFDARAAAAWVEVYSLTIRSVLAPVTMQ